MVKHIVLWKFKENALGNSDKKNYEMIKEGLEDLVGRVPGLVYANVAFNFNPEGYTACLESVFETKDALMAYQVHPDHMKVKKTVHEIICDRAVVDFEM